MSATFGDDIHAQIAIGHNADDLPAQLVVDDGNDAGVLVAHDPRGVLRRVIAFAVTRSRMMIAMSWDSRIERQLERYPALRAIGHTPLVPVHLFREELPEVEVNFPVIV